MRLGLLHRQKRPASSRTVATQMAFEPDMGGVSSGSMMMKPICAIGSLAGTSRFTCRKTPPRGSLRTKLRRAPSLAMKRDCSHRVSPGGGMTPPTITSPTSPSAWQVTTWMILDDRMGTVWEAALGEEFASVVFDLAELRSMNSQLSHLSRHHSAP